MYHIPEQILSSNLDDYTHISWVFELPASRLSALDYLQLGSNHFPENHFFWNSKDNETSIVGLGSIHSIVAPDYEEMDCVRQTYQRKTFHNATSPETGLLLLGGFEFDSKAVKTGLWKELSSGYFFVPELMITRVKETFYLTINLAFKTKEDLILNWNHRVKQWNELLSTSIANDTEAKVHDIEELSVQTWLDKVDQAINDLKHTEDFNKVVLARMLKIESKESFDRSKIVSNLIKEQTNTYVFYLHAQKASFLGATPERLLLATTSDFSSACVAGSIKRGATEVEDESLGNQLLNDLKNNIEHRWVMDSIEYDLSTMTKQVSEKGTPILLKNRDIQHLFFQFKGERLEEVSLFEALQTLHPTPALGGYPKQTALKWLKENENLDRGMYGAPIGWCATQSDVGEFAVAIRSALVLDYNAYLYAGCGIVDNSSPEEERIETKIKFNPMLRAIGGEKYVASR